jgi:hypothetical protein
MNNQEGKRLFGATEVGKTIFGGSMLKNPTLSQLQKKHFNNCHLGETTTVDEADEVEARRDFFRGNWM